MAYAHIGHQARGETVTAEHIIAELQCKPIRVIQVEVEHLPHQHLVLRRVGIVHQRVAGRIERNRLRHHIWFGASGLPAAEVFFHRGLGLFRRHIADYHDGGQIRAVGLCEMILHLRQGQSVNRLGRGSAQTRVAGRQQALLQRAHHLVIG